MAPCDVAEKAGCYFTKLKVNHKFGDLYSSTQADRTQAMAAGKRLIDSAAILGVRWIRFPIPNAHAENPVAHRELADYGDQKSIQLLVENSGWTGQIPGAVSSLVKAIGRNIAACPDTGNWSDSVRLDGLKQSFPGAANCDFKVFTLAENRHHKPYDLKTCFDIGWKASFRGPWVIEHMKPETKNFIRDTCLIRDWLQSWIADARKNTL